MKFTKGKIEGLWILEPEIFGDNRGYFLESFRKDQFHIETGLQVDFVQDNESMSGKNILRGLHLQKPPYGQGKLVRVTRGAVLDIAVDIRKNSPSYGRYQMIELNATNKLQFFIPEGFAHGFMTLEDDTVFQYKCTNYYAPEHETGIRWNDPDLDIPWPDISGVTISAKDEKLPLFNEFISPY